MKPLELVRGSTRHRILAELERYPDSWFRWYQFPELDDVSTSTIHKAISRLIRDRMVRHRRVKDEPETAADSDPKRRVRFVWYTEIRHQPEED